MRILAGFDLGTTGCRCVLFDEQLSVLGEGYHEYALFTGENGVAEQEAEDWWRLLIRALQDASAQAHCKPSDICAVSLSSQGITVVPVDEAINPLCRAINWLDQRPDTGCESILEGLGERYAQITARLMPKPYGISKIMWLRAHRPELTRRTWKYLMPMDFIIARLCGRAVTDHSMAAGLACYDMSARAWSKEVLVVAGISEKLLPEIVDSGVVAGYINPQAAATTGLAAGTPVVVGAQDQKCGAFAAAVSHDTATVSMGTCAAIMMKADRPICCADRYIPCFPDLFREGYLLEGCINVGAGCLKWYRDLYYPEWEYAQVAALAGKHVPTPESPLFFPHLSGMSTPRRWANGTAGFFGLRMGTSADAMAHAVLESIGFALRQNIEAARETAGVRVETLRVFGGGARSPEWLQILADTTGLSIESLYTHEICCVGAAMLAGIGAGVFKHREAQALSVRVGKTYAPNPTRTGIYAERFHWYDAMEVRIYAPQQNM